MLQVQLIGQHCEQYERGDEHFLPQRIPNREIIVERYQLKKKKKNLKRLQGGPGLPTGNDSLQEIGNMFRNHMRLENSLSLKPLKFVIWLRHSLVVEFRLSLQKSLGSTLL